MDFDVLDGRIFSIPNTYDTRTLKMIYITRTLKICTYISLIVHCVIIITKKYYINLKYCPYSCFK